MNDLAAFLLARYEEVRRVAAAVVDTPGRAESWWEVRRSSRISGLFDVAVRARTWIIASAVDPESAQHIARHDPGHVLADCEAKKKIVELHRMTELDGCEHCGPDTSLGVQEQICLTLRLLAAPFADHPGFRPEWRAET